MAGDGRATGVHRSAARRAPTGTFAVGAAVGALALAALALAALALAGCTDRSREAVRPVDPGAGSTTTTQPPGPDHDASPTAAGAAVPAGVSDPPHDDPAATVQDVLARYDRVVTALHGDPSAFLRPGDPLLAEWVAVVPPGAVLADDIRTDVLGRLTRGEAIPVEGGRLSYVHHAVGAQAVGPDRLSFTWCGWSPGVVRDVATGSVVDDGVAAAAGTGTVERTAGGWVLASLDQTSIDVLPAGSPDPCPAAEVGP
ncbi:hypothetical protein [Dermatobacter hominis]|uniref:hypothetical protein n=1 Tax=Dermatobacter hominis TaxID=2884263 RepID=UPI001D111DAB|nr:hypothetical protein [Dermatobacter hominis]UDY35415.1 hypothetical protein LH044_19050 [Dermatobacter hominis]